MKKNDPVTPQVRRAVLTRDQWKCVAPVIDPSESGNCWGRLTLDHIKTDPRMSKRATSDPAHLVAICQGHMEDGRKAGYQWNTAHRPELREYLRTHI